GTGQRSSGTAASGNAARSSVCVEPSVIGRGPAHELVPHGAVWTREKRSPTEVRYRYASDELEVVKDFTIVADDYVVRMTVKVTVRPPEGKEAHEQLAISVYAFQDPGELKNGSSRIAARAWSSSTLRDDSIISTDV